MEQKKSMLPTILVIIGLVYLIWPIDVPGPIDDLLINAITLTVAYFISKAQKKVCETTEKVSNTVQEKIMNSGGDPELNKLYADAVANAAKQVEASSVQALDNLSTSTQNKVVERSFSTKSNSFS